MNLEIRYKIIRIIIIDIKIFEQLLRRKNEFNRTIQFKLIYNHYFKLFIILFKMPSMSIWPLEAQGKSTKQTEMDTFSNFSNKFHFAKVYKDKRNNKFN